MAPLVDTINELRPAQVYAALGSAPAGLTTAQAAERLRLSGPNEIREVRGKPLYMRFAANFTHVMALLLWAGGAIAFVAQFHDPHRAEIFLRLGVHTFSTITWGVNRICEVLHASGWASHTSLGTGDVELLEASLPSLLAGHAARDAERAGEIQVVAVTRHGRTFLAVPGSVLEEGDVLHIAAANGAIGRLASFGLS